MKSNRYFIDKEDDINLINENTIPETNGMYKYLINKILKKYSGKNMIKKYVAEMLYMICFTKKQGISAKQASSIYNLSGLNNQKHWKFQHLLAGFVYDYWNIRSDKNGGLAECYYGEYKPLKKNINDIRIPAALIPIYTKALKEATLNTMAMRYNFWYKNIPDECKHSNM
tara:strand:- start:30659 stop:31168 length:510 start_codon:yes stop_codon:yes gene_type:complete